MRTWREVRNFASQKFRWHRVRNFWNFTNQLLFRLLQRSVQPKFSNVLPKKWHSSRPRRHLLMSKIKSAPWSGSSFSKIFDPGSEKNAESCLSRLRNPWPSLVLKVFNQRWWSHILLTPSPLLFPVQRLQSPTPTGKIGNHQLRLLLTLRNLPSNFSSWCKR